jgi:hypothetical protein
MPLCRHGMAVGPSDSADMALIHIAAETLPDA